MRYVFASWTGFCLFIWNLSFIFIVFENIPLPTNHHSVGYPTKPLTSRKVWGSNISEKWEQENVLASINYLCVVEGFLLSLPNWCNIFLLKYFIICSYDSVRRAGSKYKINADINYRLNNVSCTDQWLVPRGPSPASWLQMSLSQ